MKGERQYIIFNKKNIYWNSLSPRLRNLSKNDIVKIMNDYVYKDEKSVKQIIEDYGIKNGITPSNFSRYLPEAIVDTCPYDKKPMVLKVNSRTVIHGTGNILEDTSVGAVCIQCGHQQYNCKCINCFNKNASVKQNTAKKDNGWTKIIESYNSHPKYQLKHLDDFFDLGSLYLLYCFLLAYEDTTNHSLIDIQRKYELGHKGMNNVTVTGTAVCDITVIKAMLASGFITIDPKLSMEDAYDEETGDFYHDLAKYRLNIYDGDKRVPIPEAIDQVQVILHKYFNKKVDFEFRSQQSAIILGVHNMHAMVTFINEVLNPYVSQFVGSYEELDPFLLQEPLKYFVIQYSLGQCIAIWFNSIVDSHVPSLYFDAVADAKEKLHFPADAKPTDEFSLEVHELFNKKIRNVLMKQLSYNNKHKQDGVIANYFPTLGMLNSWEEIVLAEDILQIPDPNINDELWSLVPNKSSLARYLVQHKKA